MMVEEIRSHLEQRLIPFWSSLRDEEYGGFYGYMDYNLRVDREAKKGAIWRKTALFFLNFIIGLNFLFTYYKKYTKISFRKLFNLLEINRKFWYDIFRMI